MATAHAWTLKGMDVKIVGVFDPAEKAAKAFAASFGPEKIYASLDELASDKSLEAVLVCNYSDQHAETLLKLFAAGIKTVFCEKALVRTLEDGEKVLKAAKKAGAKVMVGHHRRYQAGYVALKNAIEEGRLGKILMAKVAYCHPGYCRQWGDFFADFERSGGVALDMMSHLYDQLNWYFGEPESVSAASLMFDRSLGLPVDFISSTVKYANGAICNVEGSWQRYGVGYDKIEVYGDKATAIFENGDKLHVYSPGEHCEISLDHKAPGQMNAFLEMAESGKAPRVGLEEGFASVKVSLGAIEAAKSGAVFKFK